jgi:60 kDa SS-A/Ro ribonucleoprotein
MANKRIFRSARPADVTRNLAGGVAYAMSDQAALTQYLMTGTFSNTFYANAEEDAARVLELARGLEPEYLAKLAVFARERGYMKDAPALLVALLAVRAPKLCEAVFARVIDNSKMLRNFVQIVRSGVTGRKSLGTAPKRLVANWLLAASDRELLNAVGQSPSIGDVIKLARPKPREADREALFGYLIGKVEGREAALPTAVRKFEAFKSGDSDVVPNVDFRLLTELPLTNEQWRTIARDAPWQMTRMNLNTFARHGVFEDDALTRLIAERLREPALIANAKVFPYQLLAAYLNAGDAVPKTVTEALIDAAEVAVANVPAIEGKVFVFPDVSGSMRSPVTGHRGGGTSKMRCVDIAALVAASVLRRNPGAEVMPFENDVVTTLRLSPRDSIMTNAEKLASIGGGGTNCSAPLAALNGRKAAGDFAIYVSDNQSWMDSRANHATATTAEWQQFRARNPGAKLACIDVQPYATVQARSGEDVLNVGGFSDAVFEALAAFARGELAGDAWVKKVERVEL